MNQTKFQFRAIDGAGVSSAGVLAAESRVDVYRQLVGKGLTPTDIRPISAMLKRGGRGGVKSKDIAHFAQQLSVLVGARIPLAEAIRSIAEHEGNPRFREILRSIGTRVEAGDQVAQAMHSHAEVFGDVFLETVKAAEKTGNLTRVLEYLAEMMDRAEETRQQIKSALTYPAVVVSVLTMAVLFLVGFVVPRFGAMFASRGVELPLLTKVLLRFGESLSAYWWAYAMGLVAAGVTLFRLMTTAEGRLAIDGMLHKVPVVKGLLIGAAVSRFARVFGLCLSSGLGLIEAIEMAGKASGRAMLQEDTARMVEQVKAGGRVSVVMEACTYLPRFARRMIAAGEESAELPKMCAVVARQYDRETAVMAKNLATVIEPVMIVLIAAVVAVVALAVFMPMWDMVKLVG